MALERHRRTAVPTSEAEERMISFIGTRRSKLTEKFCVWLPAASRSLKRTLKRKNQPLRFLFTVKITHETEK